MPRVTRRDMPDAAVQAAHLYLSSKFSESAARSAKGNKDHGPYSTVAAYCRAHGQQDDKGSYIWWFPSPLTIGGKKYTGMKLQASQPSPRLDEEKAQALIEAQGPEAVAAATHTEIVWDYEYIFLLRQQGRISPGELRDVLITPGKEYSLIALQGE